MSLSLIPCADRRTSRVCERWPHRRGSSSRDRHPGRTHIFPLPEPSRPRTRGSRRPAARRTWRSRRDTPRTRWCPRRRRNHRDTQKHSSPLWETKKDSGDADGRPKLKAAFHRPFDLRGRRPSRTSSTRAHRSSRSFQHTGRRSCPPPRCTSWLDSFCSSRPES